LVVEISVECSSQVELSGHAEMPAVIDSFDSETDFNAELEGVIGSVVVQAREQADAN
jgi:hypothetical protein